GSYRLPRIMSAPDGSVLALDGSRRRLHDLLRGRISVLAFMYTYCRDPVGCPRALAVMEAARAALLGDATLARSAQLVSLSFDPSNDTPQAMRLYGGNLARDARVRWLFLTTASVAELLPLLRGFGQDVSVEPRPGPAAARPRPRRRRARRDARVPAFAELAGGGRIEARRAGGRDRTLRACAWRSGLQEGLEAGFDQPPPRWR
ncbi:MAG: SCO family protein, partial [Burkholderiales bacterium]|nr:SCO family protein [Burkholderiales bacterium]